MKKLMLLFIGLLLSFQCFALDVYFIEVAPDYSAIRNSCDDFDTLDSCTSRYAPTIKKIYVYKKYGNIWEVRFENTMVNTFINIKNWTIYDKNGVRVN